MTTSRTIIAAGLGAFLLLAAGCAHRRPAAPAPSRAADAPGISLIDYRCAGGATIRAAYPTADTALIRYRGHIHEMRIARSADGARYIGLKLVWWSKGTGPGASGTLFARKADGTTGKALQHCHQTHPAGSR